MDQAILSEEDRVVVIRFGHDWDPTCMRMDETLFGVSERVKNFAVIYLVDLTQVPDFNKMYELYDPCAVMFFYRNKHIMIDLGTGNNNKVNWAIENKQEMIDIIETVYRGASKGRGLVVSPKGTCGAPLGVTNCRLLDPVPLLSRGQRSHSASPTSSPHSSSVPGSTASSGSPPYASQHCSSVSRSSTSPSRPPMHPSLSSVAARPLEAGALPMP